MPDLIDMAYVDEASDGNADLKRELLSLFMEQLESQPDLMKKLADTTDYDSLAKTAHKFKASALYMGMSEMAIALKKLEIVSKKLYVRSDITGLSATDKMLYINQINGLTEDLDKWTDANLSHEGVLCLINFCKLQSQLAIKETQQFLTHMA